MSAHIATKLLTDCQYCWLRVHRAKQQMYGDRRTPPRLPSRQRRAISTPSAQERYTKRRASTALHQHSAGTESAPGISVIIFGNYEYFSSSCTYAVVSNLPKQLTWFHVWSWVDLSGFGRWKVRIWKRKNVITNSMCNTFQLKSFTA